jgi:hypothetical protein
VKSVEEADEEGSVQGFCTLVKNGFGEREGRRYISELMKTSPRMCGFRIRKCDMRARFIGDKVIMAACHYSIMQSVEFRRICHHVIINDKVNGCHRKSSSVTKEQ